MRAASIAEGPGSTAEDPAAVLPIVGSRARRLRQWIVGNTPDQVVAFADAADARWSYTRVPSGSRYPWATLFHIYQYVPKRFGDRGGIASPTDR